MIAFVRVEKDKNMTHAAVKNHGSITIVNSFSQKLSGEEVLAGFELEFIQKA